MTNYLVTGGAGFIGSHIAETLVGRGETVRVLDNLSTGKRENLASFAGRRRVRRRRHPRPRDLPPGRRGGGLRPPPGRPALGPALGRGPAPDERHQRHRHPQHAAGRAGTPASGASSWPRPRRSTATTRAPEKVEGREGKPLSPYAVSKLVDEKYAQVFHDLFGFRAISLSYFNVFGPRQDPFSQYAAVIPLFITLILRGESPTIYGDGEQSRDFTYIDNVVQGNILAATSGQGGGEAFNVACGERLTVNALLAAVNGVLGTSVEAVHAEPRPGDIKHSTADFGKARRVLGFEPRVPFLVGLRRTVEWYKNKS